MDLTNFMDRSVKSDRIVVVITPEYVRKATERVGGVGYETSIISADVLANQFADRVVPIIRMGAHQPAFLQSRVYVNFTDDQRFGTALQELRDALLQNSARDASAKAGAGQRPKRCWRGGSETAAAASYPSCYF